MIDAKAESKRRGIMKLCERFVCWRRGHMWMPFVFWGDHRYTLNYCPRCGKVEEEGSLIGLYPSIAERIVYAVEELLT